MNFELSEWVLQTVTGAILLRKGEANTPSDAYLMSSFDNRMVTSQNSGNSRYPITMEFDVKEK